MGGMKGGGRAGEQEIVAGWWVFGWVGMVDSTYAYYWIPDQVGNDGKTC